MKEGKEEKDSGGFFSKKFARGYVSLGLMWHCHVFKPGHARGDFQGNEVSGRQDEGRDGGVFLRTFGSI